MRTLKTLAAPKKGSNGDKLKQFSAEQLKLMVSVLKKAGVPTKANGPKGYSLNGVFWLGETRNGGLMLLGGEDGFTGDENFGYEISTCEQGNGKSLHSSGKRYR